MSTLGTRLYVLSWELACAGECTGIAMKASNSRTGWMDSQLDFGLVDSLGTDFIGLIAACFNPSARTSTSFGR